MSRRRELERQIKGGTAPHHVAEAARASEICMRTGNEGRKGNSVIPAK